MLTEKLDRLPRPLPSIDETQLEADRLRRARRRTKSSGPNSLVRWAFYFSIFAIPFARLYLPGTGDRLGVKRIVQLLIIAAIISRPKVCLRFVPVALLWFLGYCAVRITAGLWLAPEYSLLWWPSTLELLQFLLPWTWLVYNVLKYPGFSRSGLWAFVAGVSLCALLHIAGIGMVEVDSGIDGRSTVFAQNANEIGETYAIALVALVALGLFQNTPSALR